jgi:hypothetical protein
MTLTAERYIRSGGVWLKEVCEDTERRGRCAIHWPSVTQIQEQLDIPQRVTRLVVAVGSGTTLLGLLRGLRYRGISIPIFGVTVGSDPSVELDRYAPYWRKQTMLERSPVPCHSPAKKTKQYGRKFDPYYEAKCLPYVRRGDCLIVVTVRSYPERDGNVHSLVWRTRSGRDLDLARRRIHLCARSWWGRHEGPERRLKLAFRGYM